MQVNNIKIRRRKRWDKPFADSWSDEQLARTLAMPLFAEMDASKFPASLSLAGIIENDTRVLHYEPGDIVAREDDYGSSAFVVMSGEVAVVLPPGLPAKLLGRAEVKQPEGWFSAFRRAFKSRLSRETRHYADASWDIRNSLREEHGVTRMRITNHEQALAEQHIATAGPGVLLGEVAALTRSPRTATMVVTQASELLEIRWQGFRDLRRYDEHFRKRVDDIYRERNRVTYLKALPIFAGLDEQAVERIAEQTLLESHGDLEWKAQRKKGDSSVPEEPSIVAQGDYVDGLLIVLNGSARMVRAHHSGTQTVGFLRAGDVFGLFEMADLRQHQKTTQAHIYGLTAVGHADLLRIPTALIEGELFEQMEPQRQQQLAEEYAYPSAPNNPGFLEFIGEHHYTNGRSTMVIDTNRCVRCDDCVTACARNHDDNPRFVRHGRHYANLMVVNACMHCVDPVCMVGCPTGAISRRLDGEVAINDETCIGCTTCATACPYDNIRMVEISDPQGQPVVDSSTDKPIVKATKCDLCVDNLGGPACQRACPHDALVRLDLTDSEALDKLLQRTAGYE